MNNEWERKFVHCTVVTLLALELEAKGIPPLYTRV